MKVFIIAAQSLDGFIAKDEAHLSTHWTSKEDAAWFSQKTKEAGVMVMGRKTFDTIGRGLPGRLTIVYSRSEVKPKGDEQPVGVLEESSELKLADLKDKKGVLSTKLSPQELIEFLRKQGVKEVAICGGTSIYSLFFKSDLVDQLLLTIEPIIFGKGLKLLENLDDGENENNETRLSLTKTHQLSSQTIVLEYKVNHG